MIPDKDRPSANPALVARLEYIFNQKIALSERTFHVVNFFQVVSLGVIAAIVLIFVQWKPLGLTADLARMAINLVIGGQVLTSVFSVLSVLSSLRAWKGYKKEKQAIFDEFQSPRFDTPAGYLAWLEWYAIAFFILVSTAIIVCSFLFVSPAVHGAT